MTAATRQPIRLRDYRVPAYLIPQTELHFELDEDVTEVVATLQLQRNPASTEDPSTLRLLGERLDLREVRLNGALLPEARYQRDEEGLTLYDLPEQATLQLRTCLRPQDNTTLEGLYRSNGLFCTQCEAEGFRHITYFLDRPDILSRYRTTIVADSSRYPVLLSNGNLTASGQYEDGRHWVCWEDPYPKPCYLFALVGGDLGCLEDEFITASGRQVALKIYTEAEQVDQCQHAMGSLKRAMRWDEERFGLEYDLDIYMIVAVQDFNFGAMENKGLNLFNARYILSRFDTATDEDFENIESVVAHEYFHNYTGNRVTCRDWFQLSLKEGLTVFRDQEFTSDLHSRAVKRIQDVRFLRDYQFPEDSGPTAHPVRPEHYLEINNFYTATVYEKGSELIRMLQTLLGRDAFTRGVQHYLKKHDGQAATVEDFLRALAEASDQELTAFSHWYGQAGTPEVVARGEYRADQQEYRLHFQQFYPSLSSAGARQPVPIPIRWGLLGTQGGELAANQDAPKVFLLEGSEAELTVKNVPQTPVPSLLRQFSAPVRLQFDYSAEELALLYQRDSDEFNRWDAGQRLAAQWVVNGVSALEAGEVIPEPTLLLESWRQILRHPPADLSFLSQLLTLPQEGYLSAQFAALNPDVLCKVLWGLQQKLGTEFRDQWRHAYAAHAGAEAEDLSAAAIGKRRFRNLCLTYLGWSAETEVSSLALQQFQQSRNMTEAMGALGVLTHLDNEEREQALGAFYEKWQHDSLVLDKWFRLLAGSRRTNVLTEVQALLEHEKFSYRTPNRVRALIGGFSQGNFFRFHRQDGQGYRWLAAQIQLLDTRNPQVASRLLTPLVRWKQFASPFREQMRSALHQISRTPALSRDVFEIVSKSMEDPA